MYYIIILKTLKKQKIKKPFSRKSLYFFLLSNRQAIFHPSNLATDRSYSFAVAGTKITINCTLIVFKMQELNTKRIYLRLETTLNKRDVVILGKKVFQLLEIMYKLAVQLLKPITVQVKIHQVWQTFEYIQVKACYKVLFKIEIA